MTNLEDFAVNRGAFVESALSVAEFSSALSAEVEMELPEDGCAFMHVERVQVD